MNTLTVFQLKKFCRAKGIKNYSKLHKKDIISLIQTYTSVIKLQRWVRKTMCKNENCSISLESIRYPCFGYVPKNGVIIYYNLYPLKDYLISTGDFRDPNTRDFYSETQLKTMDKIEDYFEKTKPKEKRKRSAKRSRSVFKASKNTKFYKKIKNRENEIQILEREMDNLIERILTEIIGDVHRVDRKFVLNTVFFVSYQLNFRRLILRDREHASYAIKKNIDGLVHLFKKVQCGYDQSQSEDHEYIINWLYQLSFNELEP